MENISLEIKKLDRDFINYIKELKLNNSIDRVKEELLKIIDGEKIDRLSKYEPKILVLELKKLLEISERKFLSKYYNSEEKDDVDFSLQHFLLDIDTNIFENYNNKYNEELEKLINKELELIDITKEIHIDEIKFKKGIDTLLTSKNKKARRFKVINKYRTTIPIVLGGIIVVASMSITNYLNNIESTAITENLTTVEYEKIPYEYEQHEVEERIDIIDNKDTMIDFDKVECNCPLETQKMIKAVSEQFNVPFEIMMTIAYVESDGNFNNSGVVSATNDYGYFQINRVNHDKIKEDLGFSSEELQKDDYKNTCAAAYLLGSIVSMYGENDYRNILGCYNGWTDWQKKPISREYVEKGSKFYEKNFIHDKLGDEKIVSSK